MENIFQTKEMKQLYARMKEAERKVYELQGEIRKKDRIINSITRREEKVLQKLAEQDYKLFEEMYLHLNKDRYVVKEIRFIELTKEELKDVKCIAEESYTCHKIEPIEMFWDRRGLPCPPRSLLLKKGKNYYDEDTFKTLSFKEYN